MIDPRQKPYKLILRRLQAESRQHDRFNTLLNRACEYVWFFQTTSAVLSDIEGMAPDIRHDELWEEIWLWTRSRPCLEWLCAGDQWPDWFQRQLLIAIMYSDVGPN